jgi:hypothetical protein
MRRMFGMASMAAAGALALAGAAGAAEVTYTYTGVFADGLDVTGVFGPALRPLAGLGFTAVFTRNDATPGASFFDDGTQSYVLGFQAPAPVRGAITVDGATWRIRDDYGVQEQAEEKDACGLGCDREYFEHFTVAKLQGADPTGTLLLYDQSYLDILGIGFGTDALSSHDYHSLGDVAGGAIPLLGDLNIAAFVFDTTGAGYLSEAYAYGHLRPTSLVVASVAAAAAPEPAAWALTILGFGWAGAMLRRQPSLAAGA